MYANKYLKMWTLLVNNEQHQTNVEVIN